MKGRVCLVTGANTGIGEVTAKALAARGARVIVASRTRERTQPVLDAIAAAGGDAVFVPLDLASLDSVRACAEQVLARDEPLHVLVNNAGLAGHQGTTAEGFELQFGVNHLGHYLLTRLLLDRLKASAPARIVNVASKAHLKADGIDYEAVRKPTKTTTALHEYEVSKLANVLFTTALVDRLDAAEVTAYSLHPGVVASDVWRRVPWPIRPLLKARMLSVEEGAEANLLCATAPVAELTNGGYYHKGKKGKPVFLAQANPAALDHAAADRLWRQSAEWVGLDD